MGFLNIYSSWLHSLVCVSVFCPLHQAKQQMIPCECLRIMKTTRKLLFALCPILVLVFIYYASVKLHLHLWEYKSREWHSRLAFSTGCRLLASCCLLFQTSCQACFSRSGNFLRSGHASWEPSCSDQHTPHIANSLAPLPDPCPVWAAVLLFVFLK